ncbi:3-isopropylmalate dehydrogenase [Sphingobacteriaceae bacterium]|nr:3-isopropylmalate dehydrogenase [Sphingobacteriaceae bacterium]
MKKRIAVLPGDGIGTEVTAEAVKVLEAIALRYNHYFEFNYGLIGAAAIDATGNPFPSETQKLCEDSDAVLMGAIGDPKYDHDPSAKIRPEQGLLALRKELGLYANIRPVRSYNALLSKVPLKPEIVKGVDFTVFRELTGGIYFGKKGREDDGNSAYDLCTYNKEEVRRITKLAFEEALKRHKKVTLVDKANVLETSRLWRETVKEIAEDYSQVALDFMYVDNAAMQLILNPRQFDVILTENMFGDILTDEASVIGGSLGLMPSASIGSKHAMYEPIHGSYPQAKGKGIANPIGSILSAAMMLDMSFGMSVESSLVNRAVQEVIEMGYLTPELAGKHSCTTSEVGEKISSFVLEEMHEMI